MPTGNGKILESFSGYPVMTLPAFLFSSQADIGQDEGPVLRVRSMLWYILHRQRDLNSMTLHHFRLPEPIA